MSEDPKSLIDKLRANKDQMSRPKGEKVTSGLGAKKPIKVLRTYLIQFIYKNSNGWAIVNATTPIEAESVFKQQTKYPDVIVTNIKETKWYGESIQLVFEGSVTTSALATVSVSLSDLIENTDAYASVDDYLQSVLSGFAYTKSEIDEKLSHFNPDISIDLSNYYTKREVDKKISDVESEIGTIEGPPGETPYIKNGYWWIGDTNTEVKAKGEDGVTPTINIDPVTKNWIINDRDTGVKALGEDGTMSFEDLTPAQKESLKGVGINNITAYFGISTNSTTPPRSWSVTRPSMTSTEKYMWMKLKITYTNGDVYETTPVVIGNKVSEGGGGNAAVHFAQEGDDTSGTNTLYFFDSSLLQGVGSYNNLLHGENPNEDIFSPNKLYVLEKNGTYKEVQDNDPEHPIVTVIDNRVYCYNEITPMFNLGEVLLSNTVKYAESSDCALFSFIVKGPFYSDTTHVQLTYDSSKIRVEYKDGNNWINISSGYIFNITNKDYYIPRRLRIIRVDVDFNASDFDGITSYLNTQLSFNNYYEIKTADILYNKTYLIYKDGRFYQRPGEDNFIMGANGSMGWVVDKNDNVIGTTSSITNNTTEGCLVWSHIGAKTNYNYLRITKGFTLDYSKYNVVYAIFKQAGAGSYATNKIYVSDGQGGGNTDGRSASYEFYKYVNIWGLGAIKCPARDVNMGGTRTIKAWLHKGYYEDNVLPKISELGITVYKQPFEI